MKLVSQVQARADLYAAGRQQARTGRSATLMMPANDGGANWPGGAFDPRDRHPLHLFAYAGDGSRARARSRAIGHGLHPGHRARRRAPAEPGGVPVREVEPAVPAVPAVAGPRRRRGARVGEGGGGRGLTVQGLPLVKPPYGRITRDRSQQGRHRLADRARRDAGQLRNHPALKGLNIPRTGRPGRIGMLVTKTLVIAGEAGSSRRRPARAARCFGRTTRRPGRRWAPSTCRRRRPDRR